MRRSLYVSALCLLIALTASAAGTVTYSVTVNTTSVSGVTGSLDFNFNPGPLRTQAASVQLLTFGGSGPLVGVPVPSGDASGSLPATVTFDNAKAFSDASQGYKYGSSLSFQVTLSGLALTAPDGVSNSGSSF